MMCWAGVGKNTGSAYRGWLLFINSDKNRYSLHLSGCPGAGRAQGAWGLSCFCSQIPLHWGSCPTEPPAQCADGADTGGSEPKPLAVPSQHTAEPPAGQQNGSSAVSAWALVTITSSRIFSSPPAFLKVPLLMYLLLWL